MKITNQHIGILIWSLFSCIPILYLLGYIELPAEISSYSETVRLTFFSHIILFFTSTSFIIEGILLIILLLNDNIKFEIKLNSPFANYWESKQELNKRKT